MTTGGTRAGQPAGARTWPDVLAAALVGTARGGGRPDALLDAVAAHALRRRAGVAPPRAGRLPEPVPADDAPTVGPAAAARAGDLLAFDAAAREAVPVRDLAGRLELLQEWLAAAVSAGRRLPPELVPALLDAGRRHGALRPLVEPAAGPLAGWLAAQRRDWAYARPDRPAPAVADDPSDVWEFGTVEQRAAYLRGLRRGDAARARELLAAAWSAEPPDHRPVLLGAVATGLSAADEPLLELALDDRRKQVRDLAADLLGRLPGSAHARRMADRARGCVRLRGDRGIAVDPPAACDPAMRRDGIAPRPPAGTGQRAWWLEEVLARTRLETWPPPGDLLSRRVPGEWATTLHRGLARAAVAQHAGAWAAALVDPLTDHVASGGQPADRLLLEALYDALPAEALAERAAAVLARGLARARELGVEQIAALCPRPWPPVLAGAVLAALEDHFGTRGAGWRAAGLCELAALRLPADTASRAAALTERLRAARPQDPGVAVLERLTAVLWFRHDMLRELAARDDATFDPDIPRQQPTQEHA